MDKKPASKKIADAIEEMIRSGVYPEDSLLPSEFELCEKYGVSRATVQKALSSLMADNYVYSVTGKGHYIKSSNRDIYHFVYSEMDGYDVEIVSVSIALPSPDVIYNLQVAPTERVVAIRRRAMQDGRPVAYDVKYIVYYPGVPVIEAEIDFSDFPKLVSNIASGYEISRELVVRCERGEENVCRQLEMPENSELICVEQKLLDSENLCIGWGKTYYLPEKFTLSATQE